MRIARLVFLAFTILPGMLTYGQATVSRAGSPDYDVESLAKIQPIDAHAHIYETAPSLNKLLNQLDLHLLDIVVVDDRDKFFKRLEPQFSGVLRVRKNNPRHVALCTTFSPYDFETSGFSSRVIAQLDKDFDNGAVAVKIYKTIGMEIKTKDGRYLMPDDPVLDPIYDEIERRNRTVVAHLAEPDSCWQPPNPKSPDYAYYTQHPDEYAYLHPSWPAKSEILRARDHMLEKHPKLRVVGAHLGSMEVDVDQMAERFDRYANFAVDTAARISYLTLQPREKVRQFLIKYQDRILYGTDVDLDTDVDLEPRAISAEEINDARSMYLRDWKYFATDRLVKYGGRSVQGLNLPESTLRKIYHDNAVRWIPGILDSTMQAKGGN